MARARLIERPNRTRAEGPATGLAFELTLSVLWDRLNDFVLVDDDAIERAVVTLRDDAHVLAEPAGAAPLAAALQEAERIRGRRVVLVISGANVASWQLAAIIERAGGPSGRRGTAAR